MSHCECDVGGLFTKTRCDIPLGLMMYYVHLWLYLIKCVSTLLLSAPSPCLNFMSYTVSANAALFLFCFYGGENKCLLSLSCSHSDNTHCSGVYLQEYELCFIFSTWVSACAFYYIQGKIICSYPAVFATHKTRT